jgi:hypothetical protein
VQGQGFSLADDYLFSINNQKEFNQLKGEPLSDIYSGIKCVKLCYHIADNQLYFIIVQGLDIIWIFAKEFLPILTTLQNIIKPITPITPIENTALAL